MQQQSVVSKKFSKSKNSSNGGIKKAGASCKKKSRQNVSLTDMLKPLVRVEAREEVAKEARPKRRIRRTTDRRVHVAKERKRQKPTPQLLPVRMRKKRRPQNKMEPVAQPGEMGPVEAAEGESVVGAQEVAQEVDDLKDYPKTVLHSREQLPLRNLEL